jgi:hypothetical protein
MKKIVAICLAALMCLALLAGCTSIEGLKKVPQGQRPESMDMEKLEPKFPSDSSLKNQLMSLATDVKLAASLEEQREKYDEFMYNAYLYVVGPYNFTSYMNADGRSISLYYDNLVNHMNTFLGEYDVSAWSAIGESSWGAQLKAEYDKLMCTPNSIRNAFPVSDEASQALVKSMYDARDALATAMDSGFEGANLESLLDDLLSARETLADNMGYESYLEFVVKKRDRIPYGIGDLQALCKLVRENLAPAVASASAAEAPNLTAAEWNERLGEMAGRFPAYAEDLSYAVRNGTYAVKEGEKGAHFAYMLYQYDVSAGKAVVSGKADDARHVMQGLGLTARNMALPREEWSISALTLYDEIQQNAFLGMCLGNLDAIYGAQADQAERAVTLDMARDVCSAAAEMELLIALYENPVMPQAEREALLGDLCAQYGISGMEDYFETSQDILMGNVGCAGRMLGGLYGLGLRKLDKADHGAAEKVLEATLAVYNAGNPIAAGYKAGLGNPYSAEGIKAIAEMLK